MSINRVVLVGRLTRDPELRQTASMEVCNFTVACDRRGRDEQADFISCVAFKQSATYLSQYGSKGDLVAVAGRIQTGSYDDKDGRKVYTTDVIADRVEVAGGKKSTSTRDSKPTGNGTVYMKDLDKGITDLESVPIDPNEDLPF
jgi:single-strand DNA-binding protein